MRCSSRALPLIAAVILNQSVLAFADAPVRTDAGAAAITGEATPSPPNPPAPTTEPSPTTDVSPAEPPAAANDTVGDPGDASDGKPHKKKHKTDADGDPDQGDIVADSPDDEVRHTVDFRFLFQTRYTATFAPTIDQTTTLDPRLNDGYSLNRIFLRATTRPRPWLSAKLLVDFSELSHKSPKNALKLAYIDLTIAPKWTLTVGLFKRTFSLLELLPIAEFEVADVGPTDTLIKDAKLGGRDAGVMIRFDPLRKRKWLSIYLAAYDGGLGGVDARPLGLVTARVVAQPVKHLRLGVDGVWRQHGQQPPPGIPSNAGPGQAVSADIRYSRKRLELRAEWLWGDRADEANRGDARTFMAAWVIAAVRLRLDPVVLMPAVRFEWLDADREHEIGRRYVFSTAVDVMDVSESVRLLIDVSHYQVQRGTYPLSIAPVLLDTSSTAIVAQVQVKI